MAYCSGAQRPARRPHQARDELSSGPPCPAGNMTILQFALQKMQGENRLGFYFVIQVFAFKMKPKFFQQPAGYNNILFILILSSYTCSCNKPWHQCKALHVYSDVGAFECHILSF